MIVIDGKEIEVPGIPVLSFLDDPVLALGNEDCRRRGTKWVRNICVHTTKGKKGKLKPGLGKNTNVEQRIGRLWATDGRHAGAHLSIDSDGSVGCHADLLRTATYHAGDVNEVSIGIEIYQEGDGGVYEEQLAVVVQLIDWLCRRFSIQRQMPPVKDRTLIPRIAQGARDVVGVYGHRHVTTNRGPGDPGDAIFNRLALSGFEQFNYRDDEDRAVWKERQQEIWIKVTGQNPSRSQRDGIAGPGTAAMLLAAGYADGMWIDPGDTNANAILDAFYLAARESLTDHEADFGSPATHLVVPLKAGKRIHALSGADDDRRAWFADVQVVVADVEHPIAGRFGFVEKS